MKIENITFSEVLILSATVLAEIKELENVIDEDEGTDEIQKKLNAIFKERKAELETIYNKLVNVKEN